MKVFSLIDGSFSDQFYPFSLTRSVADIRVGILTIREKWEMKLAKHNPSEKPIDIPANLLPDLSKPLDLDADSLKDYIKKSISIRHITDILHFNGIEIAKDYAMLTAGRHSHSISSTNHISGREIFIEEGAIVEHCYLNAEAGPIYIGKNSLVMEGSMIRGPFAIGENGVVKMGTKIYGATSAGPHCVLGGEIKNSVIFGFSNKAHDGYLGDSVIGEWCNLGGGSSNSNLKNSIGNISLWNPITGKHTDGGSKCGLFMGDYSRSAINTSFTTGAVIGVSCHVFGIGATPSYLPSFSWGYDNEKYLFEKALDHIAKWKNLKGHVVEESEKILLKNIFDKQNQSK